MSRSTEGWIQKRTRTLKSGKQSTKYIGRIKPPGMEEIYSTPFDKKGTSKEFGTAAYWLAEQRELLRNGQLADPRTRSWTVYEWAEQWHEQREVADVTDQLYRSMIANDIKPSPLGAMLLTAVEDTDVLAWMKDMSTNRHWVTGKNLAISTVNVRRSMLSAVFKGARKKKLVTDNPVYGVPKLREQPAIIPLDPNDIPTKRQVWAWCDVAGTVAPRLREAIIVAAGTGMRPGELFGLQESQITRNRKGAVTEIYVSRQLKLGISGTHFGRLKTDNSYRRIPVGTQVAQAIDRHLKQYPLEPETPHGDIIFRGPKGRPWARSTFDDQWGLIRGEGSESVWYRFRHYYISGLIEGGASPKLVMERAGHGSPAYTLTRYARLWPTADEKTASLSDAALERDIDGTPDDS